VTETKQRSLLERLVGRPLAWLAWVWAALAVVWIVTAVVDPSGLHTSTAIVWSLLAVAQVAAAIHAGWRARSAARAGQADEIAL
jgi:cytochrome oxidase assembly protein ShyY1